MTSTVGYIAVTVSAHILSREPLEYGCRHEGAGKVNVAFVTRVMGFGSRNKAPRHAISVFGNPLTKHLRLYYPHVFAQEQRSPYPPECLFQGKLLRS